MKTYWLFLCFLFFDLVCFAQERDYEQSVVLFRQGKFEQAKAAVLQAINHAIQKGNEEQLSLAYTQKALIVWETDGITEGFKVTDSAIGIAQKLPRNSIGRIAAHSRMGQLHVQQMELKKAAIQFKIAEHAVDERLKINRHRIGLYNQIALMHLMEEDFPKAKSFAQMAYNLNLKLQGKNGIDMPSILQTLFFISNYNDQYQDAIRYGEEFERLVKLHYQPGHRIFGVMHNSLAIVYEALHQYEKALYHRQLAVAVQSRNYQNSKNTFSLGAAYQNLGTLYGYINEDQLASSYLDKGSVLLAKTYGENGAGMVNILVDLAVSKQKTGLLTVAEALFERAYKLQKFHDGKNFSALAYVESFFADLRIAQGRVQEGIDLYRISLAHYEMAGTDYNKTALLTKQALAKALAAKQQFPMAISFQLDVLEQFRKIYPSGNDAIALQLEGLSETYLSAGLLDQSLNFSNQVFVELLHLKQSDDPTGNFNKLPFSYNTANYIKHHLEILQKMYDKTADPKYLSRIVSITDRYSNFISSKLYLFRTQASLGQLSALNKSVYNIAMEACWKLRGLKSKDDLLLKIFKYSELGKTLILNLAANNLLVETAHSKSSANPEVEKDIQFRRSLSALNLAYLQHTENDSLLNLLSAKMEQYRVFQDSLKKAGHKLMSLKQGLSVPSINELRSQLLGRDKVLIEFAVTGQSVFTFVLDDKTFRIYRSPRKILEQIGKLKELRKLTPSLFSKTSGKLYQELIKPLEKHFRFSQLVIIPDGELYNLNFELLVRNGTQSEYSKMDFLINSYEISYLLSASSAWAYKKVSQNANNNKALIFAPVFTQQMKSSYINGGDVIKDDADIYRYLYRQPFALKAAQRIVDYVPGDLYTEQKAQEASFKQAAPAYRYLHLGTHAQVDNIAPLQSRLFFAKSPPNDSLTFEDGYLHAYEIYAMQLKAELAVLTACETGRGAYRQGEGVMSLAHSFLHAGCSSVIMSLWKIDDKTSAGIITDFYRRLSRGASKSQALRLAKLEYLSQTKGEMSNPYFWAGLALIGDEGAVTSGRTGWLWYLIIGGLLLAGGGYLLRRRRLF